MEGRQVGILTSRTLIVAVGFLVLLLLLLLIGRPTRQLMMPSSPQLLSDPFLQLPATNSVRVVWFTEFAGFNHTVAYGENFKQTAVAATTKLSRTREDRKSRVGAQSQDGQVYQEMTTRNLWRHEAEVTGLIPELAFPTAWIACERMVKVLAVLNLLSVPCLPLVCHCRSCSLQTINLNRWSLPISKSG